MDDLTQARLSAHWAAQVASAAATTLNEAREDFGHTNLGFSEEHEALVGQPLPDGRAVGLRLRDLTLLVTGSDAALPLEGLSVEEAMAWLGEQLGAELARPKHEMPDPPGQLGPGSAALSTWFKTAQREIEHALPESEVRCWPHHFDLAALLVLDPDAPSEEARTVGVGMSPGDGSYETPYWYVTPWPYPKEGGELPDLPGRGEWHTTGWTGAVLVDVQEPAEVREFLRAAVTASRELAGA